MRVDFTKMHGLGNDFVVIDHRARESVRIDRQLAAALADRSTGIGCDQLIVLEPSETADFRMRIFNADGGEVEACGNASRAIALFHGSAARIETAGGMLDVTPENGGAAVAMGKPRFGWEAIPLDYAMDTREMPMSWEALGRPFAVNVGNPHAVFCVRDVEDVDLGTLGPQIEHDPVFPEGVNVGVASVDARDHISLRVWERGAGLTRACGTGACAAAVAAVELGLADRTVTVDLPGGSLVISYREDGEIVMRGPATESFRGSFDPTDYGAR
jgi:diaminopimelate epimerase